MEKNAAGNNKQQLAKAEPMKNMRCRGRQRAASCDFFPSEERKKEKAEKDSGGQEKEISPGRN